MREQSGFTLVEVLVAASLMSLVLLSLFAMTNTMQMGYRQHRCAVDAAQNGRQALLRLTRDIRLATAVTTTPGSEITITTTANETIRFVLADGSLMRIVGGSQESLASGLTGPNNGSAFAPDPAGTWVEVHLVVSPAGNCPPPASGADRTLKSRIYLYNRG
jgi:prepilin-type N-terminal cleavage/methylation domain-containing protein